MKWINIKETLPEYTTHVMGNKLVSCLISMNGMVTEAIYEEGEFKTHLMKEPVTEYVTHWMYLPKSPSENQEINLEPLKTHARNIYDVIMNAKCESTIQELFTSKTNLHDSMTELIDGLDILEDKLKGL